ncbi:MAG: DoxX family membrane protein [Bacteroidales bacterium]|nr:DoxX family membrane protein [Bacteroidales bacterium]
MKKIAIVQSVIRMMLGIMFIVAAILKLISLDNFEIYIYSYQLFSLSLTALAARGIIAFEMLLGIFLLFKFYYRETWWVSMCTMAAFTLFLIYAAIFRNDTNCHCFGDIVPINPVNSIIKNLIVIGLLIFIYNRKQPRIFAGLQRNENSKLRFQIGLTVNDYSKKFKKWIISICGVAAFIVSFILFPPNYFYNMIFSENEYVITQVYEQAKKDSSLYIKLTDVQYDKIKDTVTFEMDTCRLPIDTGRYLIAIMGSGCKYCKQSANLIRNLFEVNQLNPDQFKILLWGPAPSLARFIRLTETMPYEIRQITPCLAIDMAKGNFPTFMLIENGEITDAFNYRGISESQIVNYLKK